MNPSTDGAMSRIRTFWRRTLRGAPIGARIEIYEELAPSLGAGIGLKEALRGTAERHGGVKRRTVELLSTGLDRDVALSETMRANPESFTPIEAALVATSERTGRLDTAFRTASAQLERTRSTRNRIIQPFLYPLLLVHCFVLMVATVRMFGGGSFLGVVVPSFLGLWVGLAVLVSLHVAWSDRTDYTRLVEGIPVVGRVVRAAGLSRFARSFAALHGAGVPYHEALRVSADASGNALIRRDAAVAIDTLERGAPLPEALERMHSLPSDDRGLLIAGEHSGELESAANRVATLEDERFDVVVKRAASVLPGCLVAIIGIAVGAYAISFYAKLYGSALDMFPK